MDQEYYSIKELSQKLGMAEITIRRWLRSKKMIGYQIGSIKKCKWLISHKELDRILREQEQRK